MRRMMSPVLIMLSDILRKIILRYHCLQAMVLAIILAAVLTSCDPNMVFEKSKTIENNAWKSNNTFKFNVPIYDTFSKYNFYLNVRIKSAYHFANLFLFMKTLYPNGQISVDTVECFLADINGKWPGSRNGELIDNRILLRKDLKYSLAGTYSFEFEQAMRDTVLENVENFGIRIEKAN
jgi:gliding motility-associated lipoprotein GldH